MADLMTGQNEYLCLNAVWKMIYSVKEPLKMSSLYDVYIMRYTLVFLSAPWDVFK